VELKGAEMIRFLRNNGAKSLSRSSVSQWWGTSSYVSASAWVCAMPYRTPSPGPLETSQLCDHETSICQHEVEKAIEGFSGGPNVGAWVWRHGELAVSGED
jgi:hypothetical protein